MNKYLYLFRGGEADEIHSSPEKMQSHMGKWETWMGELAKSGKLIDGLPLAQDGKQVNAQGIVTDGPFAEGNEVVGGYLIILEESLENAAELSKGCPIFEHNGEVEVREIMNMG